MLEQDRQRRFALGQVRDEQQVRGLQAQVGVIERVPLPGGKTFISQGRLDFLGHPGAGVVIGAPYRRPSCRARAALGQEPGCSSGWGRFSHLVDSAIPVRVEATPGVRFSRTISCSSSAIVPTRAFSRNDSTPAMK